MSIKLSICTPDKTINSKFYTFFRALIAVVGLDVVYKTNSTQPFFSANYLNLNLLNIDPEHSFLVKEKLLSQINSTHSSEGTFYLKKDFEDANNSVYWSIGGDENPDNFFEMNYQILYHDGMKNLLSDVEKRAIELFGIPSEEELHSGVKNHIA